MTIVRNTGAWIHPVTGEVLDHKGRRLTPEGREILDPTPVAPPVGYKKQPSMADHIRDMVRSERLRQEAEAAGAESFEEADDFDVDDDPEISTPYEVYETEPVRELARRLKEEEATPPAPPPSESPEPAPAGSPAPTKKSGNEPSAPEA